MKLISLLLIFNYFTLIKADDISKKIKHVIVLMLENRSFDHMLGFLKSINNDIDGCLPNEEKCYNHVDPMDTTSEMVTVDNTAVYVQVDPHHSIAWTTEQIYGFPKDTKPPDDAVPTMDGFINAYVDAMSGNITNAKTIMKCFDPEHVPVIANLAQEYGVFDSWFAAVPGPTMVNRAYAASATSHGMGTNDEVTIAKGLPQTTMFKQLRDMGLDYKVYFQDVPSVLQFKDMRHKEARGKYFYIDKIYEDLETGDIPEFVWIEPAYFNGPNQPATDQHPDHDVSLGEELMNNIYTALRNSPIWEESLLMITYDEHGGFFDHVAPAENVPNPDGLESTDDPFDFTRLGVRIPTVAISPWIKKNSVFHNNDLDLSSSSDSNEDTSTEEEYAPAQYEHSSIVSTVIHKIFSPKEGYPAPEYLTKRDAWAKSFEDILNVPLEDGPRTDCPASMPKPYQHRALMEEAVRNGNFSAIAGAESLAPIDGSMPLSDLQRELLAVMAGAVGLEPMSRKELDDWTEAQASEYCNEKMKLFLSSSN